MMSPRTKNLALAGGAVAVVGFIGVNTLMAPAAPPPAATEAPAPAASPSATTEHAARAGTAVSPDVAAPAGSASPAADPSAPGAHAQIETARRSYAVGLQDLAGFPPDAAPGTQLELWVTWEPPVTRGPRLQKLVGDVVLERTIPGTVPEAPVSALLSVPADRVGDLIYADTFGKLSVALPE